MIEKLELIFSQNKIALVNSWSYNWQFLAKLEGSRFYPIFWLMSIKHLGENFFFIKMQLIPNGR